MALEHRKWADCGDAFELLQLLKLFIKLVAINSFISIHQWLYSPLLGPGLFFSFVIFFYTDGMNPWRSDQPVARPLSTHRKHKQRINAHTHKTSMA
jgi:hypothetical protein